MSDTTLRVRVAGKRALTPTVTQLDLRPLGDVALPAFQVGAHINVVTPGGHTRSYSLNNDPQDGQRYLIAVRRTGEGRGGSASLVDNTSVGDTLTISEPRNSFPLHAATRYLLIAGGIGITPIRAMLRSILAAGIRDVHLIYLTRSAADTAYYDELTDPGLADYVTLYHRAEHGGAAFDFWPYLADPGADARADANTAHAAAATSLTSGTALTADSASAADSAPTADSASATDTAPAADRRIFCCGPESLQEEIRALTMHWRPSTVHFEDFNGVSAFGEMSAPFRAVWQPTGTTVAVSAQETLLDALRREGATIASSCESGTCGTCRIRLISGTPIHRDVALSAAEREEFVMPCVSRAHHDIVVAPLQ
jgi:phthalate 4,5-dioxygenase reductase subunit